MVAERWIEESSSEFDLEQFRHGQRRFDWHFINQADLAPWKLLRIDGVTELTGRALALETSIANPSLLRTVDIAASQIDSIRVRLVRGGGPMTMQLYWAGEGEQFGVARSLRAAVENPGRIGPSVCTFAVGQNPAWKGRVKSLRFDFLASKGRKIEVLGIRGIGYKLDRKAIGREAGQVVIADFDSDRRLALLGSPLRPIEKALDIQPSARLRLGYGLPFRHGEAVQARVVVRIDGKPERVLYEADLHPSTDSRQWFDLELGLSEFAGERASLSLEAVALENGDSDAGPLLWSSPAVVVPQKQRVRRPNVIVIVVDTLRPDRMSLYGHDRPTTPRLDAWAQRNAVVFENAVAPAPWTLPSHVSLFSGLAPLRHGINFAEPAPDRLQLIAESLRERGYYTAALTGGGFLNPFFGLAQGFDRYRYWPRVPGRSLDHVGKDLGASVTQAVSWLDEMPRPFFLFLHTYEVHAPYQPWEPWYSAFREQSGLGADPPIVDFLPYPKAPRAENGWRAEFGLTERVKDADLRAYPMPEEHLPLLHAAYDSGVAHTDDKLAELLEALEQRRGLMNDTLLVLTSDHGESLGERGTAGHAYLWDFNIRIPLVVAFPGDSTAGRRVADQVQLIDVVPTVLDLAGLEKPPELAGSSLLRRLEIPKSSRPAIAESYAGSTNFGVGLRVANRWKFIYQNSAWAPSEGKAELYDLRTDADELTNLAASLPEKTARFEAELRRRFEETATYLRIRFQNRSARRLTVSFHGGLARPFGVRAFELPDGIVQWRNGSANVELAAGQDVTLYFEGSRSDPTRIEASLSVARGAELARWKREFRTWDSLAGITYRAVTNSWIEVESLGPEDSGMLFDWHGHESGNFQRTPSRALEDQLKALGYLN